MRVHTGFVALTLLSLSIHFVSSEIRYCNDGLGECTPFKRCSNLTVFNDGRDHINVRFNIELETDACHYLEMCCDPEDVIPDIGFKEFGIGETEKEEMNYEEIRLNSDKTDNTDNTENLFTISGFTEATNSFDTEKKCNKFTEECIPFFLCADDHSTDGANILSSRFGENEDKCLSDSQVCCEKSKNIKRSVPTTCGLRNKDGIGYTVTNGIDEAQFAEFPWMAAISELQFGGEPKYACGGSLIDSNVILTAAHCVNNKDPNNLIVRLGEWDTQTINEILPHSDHEVMQIIVHPEFGAANLFNDVALLVLKNPAKRSAHINTVCLPPQNYKFEGECFVSGWGTDVFGSSDFYRVNLKKLELPVVQLRDCQTMLRQTKLGPRFRLNPSFMCAGGEHNVDTCTGDGGSPLVCKVPGHEEIFYQAGIVAWGVECGLENVPGVYANVAKFRSWIDGQMNELGYGTASYTLE